MKQLIISFFVVFFSFVSYGQDPQLFENIWYLHKIILDDGTEHIPIANEDVQYIPLVFYEEDVHNPYYFETVICNYFVGYIAFEPSEFSIYDTVMSLAECEPYANYSFEEIQFGFFLTETYDYIEDPFQYEVIIENDEKTLIITNVRNDKAIYGETPPLSVTSNTSDNTIIYPNPVREKLYIQNFEQGFTSIAIYNLSGSKINTQIENNTVDVSELSQGIYFLSLTTIDGGKTVKKFIKK